MSRNRELSQRSIAIGTLVLAGLLLVAVAAWSGGAAGAAYAACDQVTDNENLNIGCSAAGGFVGGEGGSFVGGELGGEIGSGLGPIGEIAGGMMGAFAGAA